MDYLSMRRNLSLLISKLYLFETIVAFCLVTIFSNNLKAIAVQKFAIQYVVIEEASCLLCFYYENLAAPRI